MTFRLKPALVVGLAVIGMWLGSATPAQAQHQPMNRFFYYPYYYFPHSYWPSQSPQYPEPLGAPYQPPPAYMAFPAFQPPHWRFEYNSPQSYHRGFHFWLDQF